MYRIGNQDGITKDEGEEIMASSTGTVRQAVRYRYEKPGLL
jgi:hypothetical protein